MKQIITYNKITGEIISEKTIPDEDLENNINFIKSKFPDMECKELDEESRNILAKAEYKKEIKGRDVIFKNGKIRKMSKEDIDKRRA